MGALLCGRCAANSSIGRLPRRASLNRFPMQYKDYYKILGVPRNADEKAIKKAYRELARQYHPDRNPGNQAAEERFKDINEAYEVLGNAENRSKYDRLGADYQRWKQMGGNQAGFDYTDWINRGGAGGYQNVNLDELFRDGGAMGGNWGDLFGSLFGNRAGGAQALRRDAEQEIEIALEEAFHGAQRTLVNADGERFTVQIPRGADTGTKVRLRGQGPRGGDLYLLVKVSPHAVYTRDGDNLRAPIQVDVLTAVLGGDVPVETLHGSVRLKIMPGTQGGRWLRLRGRGMPHLRQPDQFGDLLVQVHIRVPIDLSDEERRLYERLAALRPVAP